MVQKVFTMPFAKNGSRTPIPDANQPTGVVSYAAGFGPDYERQLGVDPLAKNIEREDYNQALYDVTQSLQEMQSGLGLPPFSLTFAATLPGEGYPRSAVVPRADGAGYWINQLAGVNTGDPTVAGTGWLPLNVMGTFTQALTNVNVTLSTTNAAFRTLILTGTLTGSVALTLPAWPGYSWVVDNRCTGAFTVTILVAAGAPVTIPAGVATLIYCDGVNIKLSTTPPQATETVAGIAEIATQGEVTTGTDDARFVTPLKLAQAILATGGMLLKTSVFNASGTWTPDPRTKKVIIEIVGAGGAGGGAGGTSAGNISVGAGGASGSVLRTKLIAVPLVATAITVGAGGTPNTSAGGGSGGATSFGSLFSIGGGNGGATANNSSSFPFLAVPGSTISTFTGEPGDIDYVTRGSAGTYGQALSVNWFLAGHGGASALGGGGFASSSSVGNQGGVGAGGSGGARAAATAASVGGGLGGDGYARIWEYS